MNRHVPANATSTIAFWSMLVLILILASQAGAATPQFPALSGRVVDEAGILSAATRSDLTEMLAQHERATGEQVVVVTLKSLQGYSIEDYGYQLGRYWGIGQKGKNTGALLIVAPAEHKVRIEVGYGLEGTLTDAASSTIIEDTILPSFRTGDFNAGVVAGTSALLTVLGNPSEGPPTPRHTQSFQTIESSLPLLLLMFFWAGFVLWRYRSGTSLHRRLGGPGPIIFPGGGFYRGGGFYGGGGLGGGGGFSGGGFSGGGGSFGGGGASGGW